MGGGADVNAQGNEYGNALHAGASKNGVVPRKKMLNGFSVVFYFSFSY